nr:hypothetical protein SHINE37_10111 [Rhizobiaceae bacterium]
MVAGGADRVAAVGEASVHVASDGVPRLETAIHI